MKCKIGKFSKDKTPHVVLPDYGDVFAPDLVESARSVVVPLATIDLSVLGVGGQSGGQGGGRGGSQGESDSKIHVLYFESGHESIIYEMNSEGKISRTDAGDEELDELEDPPVDEDVAALKDEKGGGLSFVDVDVDFREPDVELKPDWDWQGDLRKLVEEKYNDYYSEFLNLRVGGYPFFYQGGFKTKDDSFIGQFGGSVFGLSDINFYLYWGGEVSGDNGMERVRVLAQMT